MFSSCLNLKRHKCSDTRKQFHYSASSVSIESLHYIGAAMPAPGSGEGDELVLSEPRPQVLEAVVQEADQAQAAPRPRHQRLLLQLLGDAARLLHLLSLLTLPEVNMAGWLLEFRYIHKSADAKSSSMHTTCVVMVR